MDIAAAVPSTTPPGVDTVLYDGHCRFCSQAARTMRRLAGGSLELLSFREEEVLARFPGLSPERCEKAMQFIRHDGRVYEGAEAAVQVMQRKWYGRLALVYYAPGLKQLADWAYGVIARYRFRIAGRTCVDGTCHLHVE